MLASVNGLQAVASYLMDREEVESILSSTPGNKASKHLAKCQTLYIFISVTRSSRINKRGCKCSGVSQKATFKMQSDKTRLKAQLTGLI